MRVRRYEPADCAAICEVLEEAVQVLAAVSYSPAQREAWVRHLRTQVVDANLRMGVTLVAEDELGVAAFTQLYPHHHVNYLYTHPRAARQGFARALLETLETHARDAGQKRLHTEASLAARTCFEACGYVVTEAENVVRQGEILTRYRMEKCLG